MSEETTKPTGNEITDLALSAKKTREAIEAASDPAVKGAHDKRWPVGTVGLAAGIGVGSAALVAALLYANRGKDKK